MWMTWAVSEDGSVNWLMLQGGLEKEEEKSTINCWIRWFQKEEVGLR